MKDINKTMYAGIVGTSVMTAFSYAISGGHKKNFREPELLGILMERLSQKQGRWIRLAGWPLHYTLGLVWAGVYIFWLKAANKNLGFKYATMFGCCSGAVAIVIWRLLFKLHPHPPKIFYKQFFAQLFIAHIIFSLSVSTTYGALKGNKRA